MMGQAPQRVRLQPPEKPEPRKAGATAPRLGMEGLMCSEFGGLSNVSLCLLPISIDVLSQLTPKCAHPTVDHSGVPMLWRGGMHKDEGEKGPPPPPPQEPDLLQVTKRGVSIP